jgi:glycerophosphoryl diester phosphodiesterase
MTTQDGRPNVIAHRGASRAHPENTLDAFRGARRLGADWVELDVRRTADRAVVVHHDPAVRRDGAGPDLFIVETPVGQLPATIPILTDVLTVCAQGGAPLGVNIEIKSAPHEPDFDPDLWIAGEVVDTIHAHPELEVLVTSFDPNAIDRVHAIDPSVPTGLLVADLSGPERIIEGAAGGGHVALNPWQRALSPEVVAAAHDVGLAVNVWTVDDPEAMTTFADWGVDGIITNVPDVARSVLR